MTSQETKDRIGELLGIHLAMLEQDLSQDPDDAIAIDKIRIISETYKNFATGGLLNFQEDFECGYQIGKQEVSQNLAGKFSAENSARDLDEPCSP